MCCTFSEHLFLSIPLEGCFCTETYEVKLKHDIKKMLFSRIYVSKQVLFFLIFITIVYWSSNFVWFKFSVRSKPVFSFWNSAMSEASLHRCSSLKRCSENVQQIYRRTPMLKCDFNKIAKQLYWNHTFQNIRTPLESCFCNVCDGCYLH